MSIKKEALFYKFMEFLNDNGKLPCRTKIYEPDYNRGENYMTCIVVPSSYEIHEIPVFKKYCHLMGLIVENEFHDDINRSKGYRQSHICTLYDDGNFGKEIKLENLLEETDE